MFHVLWYLRPNALLALTLSSGRDNATDAFDIGRQGSGAFAQAGRPGDLRWAQTRQNGTRAALLC